MRISDWSSDVCSSDLKAQQLDLQGQGNVADLVEKQRAAMREFDLAFGRLDRAGERALFMPEQLAFEQILGDRGAVDRDERAVAPRARLVQPAREQFLAGAARAEQHDRNVKVRSEEHTSELQSLMRISYAVFCLKKKTRK